MKEIVQLHIGECGVQIGNSCWELFSLGHNIQQDGKQINGESDDGGLVNIFFQENSKGIFTPRSLFMDLDQNSLDSIQSGPFKQLYCQSQFLHGNEDASNIFSKGYQTQGKTIIDPAKEKIRQILETCESFQGFLITLSVCGGTGSGFGSLLIENLATDYLKKSSIGFFVYPSQKISTQTVQTMNALFATHTFLEHNGANILFENEQIYDICSNQLRIKRPNYSNINQIISQSISSITSSFRFNGPYLCDLNQFQTNMIPYPRIQFLISSYSPFIQKEKQDSEQLSIPQLTKELFLQENQLIKCDTSNGKQMALYLQYNGDVTSYEVTQSINQIKSEQTFSICDWVPTAFKVGITQKFPKATQESQLPEVQRAASLVLNTTSVSEIFKKINKKYDVLNSRHAYKSQFHYEGIQSGLFYEAREQLEALLKDYEELEMTTNLNEEEEN